PESRNSRNQPAYERPASVVSNAKLARCSASVCRRSSMMRLASTAALSGEKPARPWAITSALTKGNSPRAAAHRLRDAVVLPAPSGPASTITLGVGSAILPSFSSQGDRERNECCPPWAGRGPLRPILLLQRPRQARRPAKQPSLFHPPARSLQLPKSLPRLPALTAYRGGRDPLH